MAEVMVVLGLMHQDKLQQVMAAAAVLEDTVVTVVAVVLTVLLLEVILLLPLQIAVLVVADMVGQI
jgi:hypothetical protein